MKTTVQNPYKPFSSFIFRSPYFSIKQLTTWFVELDRSPEYLKEIVVRPDIQEAIFLASPVLYDEISKYLKDSLKPKDKEKIFFSMLKYLSRMASRCTPFGLFAGCSVGYIAKETDIRLPDPKDFLKHTRLDMNYLCALAQNFAKRVELRHRLLYFPNNSSYIVWNMLRYIEYHFQNGNRQHNIVAVEHTEYLQCLLKVAREGATVAQLTALLVNDRISYKEAIEYIDELIDNQVLVSELEPSVTGPEFLDQLINTIEKYDDLQELAAQLKSLSEMLQKVNSLLVGSSIPLYEEIKKFISELGTSFNEKHLFQSDMLKPCKRAVVDKKITDDLLEVITFMNKISLRSRQETLLDRFATSFTDRFEEQEIPLAQLLDAEMGLDLHQLGSSRDMSPLLDGIPFGVKQQENVSYAWNWVQSMIHRKVIEALIAGERIIALTEDDVKNVSAEWDDLSHTISVMCEVLSINPDGTYTIYMPSVSGTGAANLLGRFCHVDKGIHQTVMDIIHEEEDALHSDKLYAEIVHLPESRIGNIVARPVLRPYEIPYLAKSGVGKEFQIELSDLMVSVRQKKFILRSKRLNKEIIPRLTTAHNYSQTTTMPIYQFLCNLQNQHYRGGIGFFLSGLFNEFPYLPRISYKNVILSLARWHVKPDDIKQIIETKETTKAIEALHQWKVRNGIPRFVVLPDGDNELFTDTESLTSFRMLYSVVKKSPQFTLREFPFDMESSILRNNAGAYTNEFLFAFHKKCV